MDSVAIATDDGGKMGEKQNVNVIFVPESILLALSKSAEGSSETTGKDVVTCSEDDGINNRFNGVFLSTGNTGGNDYLKTLSSSTSQEPSFFVLDPGEWFVDTDQSGLDGGIVVLPKPDGPKQPKGTADVSPAKSNDSKTDGPNIRAETDILNSISKNVDNNVQSKTNRDSNSAHRKLKCPAMNCGKVFTTSEKLENHVKTHSSDKPYPCPVLGCTWSFSTPYKLRRHEHSHKQSKLFKCTYPGCDVSCSTKYNLKVHTRFHEEQGFHQCEHCSANFRSRMKLVKHLRTVHKAEPMYKCPFPRCEKRFYTIPAQKVHEKWHHRAKFVCGVEGCQKQFSVISGFRMHFKTVHSGDRPYKCDYPGCKWEFATNSNLKRHSLTHTDDKNFACPMPGCHSRFYRKDHLRSHLRVHKPESESKKQDLSLAPVQLDLDGWEYYFCPYEDCGSLFTNHAGAKQHILKSHTIPAQQELMGKNQPSETIVPEQRVPILSPEVDHVSEASNKIPIEIVSSELHTNQCEIPSSSQATIPTQSILQTLMEAEPSTELAANETINTTSLHATLSSAEGNFDFIASNSQPLNVTMSPEIQATQTASPTTMSTIDPSQFLLDSNVVFTPTTSTYSQESEGVKFVNLQQSASTAIPDGFLSFNDLTVDPNVVMSLHSPMPNFPTTSSTLSSAFDASDDENCFSGRNDPKSSGSARTNYMPYLRRKSAKRFSPVTIQEGKSGEVREGAFIGFQNGTSAFNFSEKTSAGFCNIADKDFAESTINLRDLA